MSPVPAPVFANEAFRPPSPLDVSAGTDTVRLQTLTLIRWVAIVGQAVTLTVVHFGFGFSVPYR